MESIRVIVSMGGKGPVGSGLKSTGGRRSELTEARARIRTITTPVPQLRLRERRARRTLMKRSNHLSRPRIYSIPGVPLFGDDDMGLFARCRY